MEGFVAPNQISKCTWSATTQNANPHSKRDLCPRAKILPNILHAIGQTPLVKLNKIPQSYGIKCDMYAKCEFLNPGGSVKDRIGYRMVEDCEERGLIHPGMTLIEPTSGNTGVGIAMASAVKGYKCVIVMPEKMSEEKVCVLKALGAQIIRTPTSAAFNSPEGLIAVSQKLQKDIPNSFILDQYRNAGNPLAHYDGTCAEILDQLDGSVDMIVGGTGTGGTVAGIGRRLKEKCPDCILVGVDPEGSILAQPESLNETETTFYEVEGIGYDFIPTVLDRSVVDVWVKTNDKEALPLARRLIQEEGFLCGASSGSALSGALKAAKNLKAGQKCVVIFPDNIRNYLSKFINDSWMIARNLLPDEQNEHWWWNSTVKDLKIGAPLTIEISASCDEAIKKIKKERISHLPVIDTNGGIKGVISSNKLITKIINSTCDLKSLVNKAMYTQIIKVPATTNLGHISRILEREPFVLIVEDHLKDTEKLIGIVEPEDILSFISQKSE